MPVKTLDTRHWVTRRKSPALRWSSRGLWVAFIVSEAQAWPIVGCDRPYNILSSKQFNRPLLDYLVKLTDQIRRYDKSTEGLTYLKSLLRHKRAMLYFTQPSTRTFLSFDSACHILGIRSSEIRDTQTSSERKGESIEDSLRTFSSYVDLIIMRTPISGLCDRIAEVLSSSERSVPIINAGSGPDEHPTQALLDIYTLHRSFRNKGGIEGKTLVMVGDLKRGRTVRSLSGLLCHYPGVKVIFVSPKSYRLDPAFATELRSRGLHFIETEDLLPCLSEADALYMTRVQDEYDLDGESRNVDYSLYHLRAKHLSMMKTDAVIMHPLPRRLELDPQIDQDSRARYWRQERNGMWTRVALMTLIFGVDQKILFPEL